LARRKSLQQDVVALGMLRQEDGEFEVSLLPQQEFETLPPVNKQTTTCFCCLEASFDFCHKMFISQICFFLESNLTTGKNDFVVYFVCIFQMIPH
jgi:hypothetical protein